MRQFGKRFNFVAYIPFMIIGVVLLAIGIYLFTRPNVETVTCQATITDIVSHFNGDETMHDVFIQYIDYNGVLHENVYFNQYWMTMQVGQTIEIQLSATDPYVINPNPEIWINLILTGSGALFVLIPLINIITHFTKKKKEEIIEYSNMPYTNNLYNDSDTLSETRKLKEGKYYFYPNPNNSRGFVLSDENHNEIYEAIPVKTAPFVTSKYIFKDKETKNEKEHKFSQTLTIESTSITGSYKKNSYFKYDGVKIWDYFQSIDVDLSISVNGLTPEVEVIKNGVIVSHIKGVSVNEASQENHILGNFMHNRAFDIDNISSDKELLFLICFTLTRIDLYY